MTENGHHELISFATKTGVLPEPYYLRLFYDYYLSESIFLGLTANINSYDGEGILLYGIQFGMTSVKKRR